MSDKHPTFSTDDEEIQPVNVLVQRSASGSQVIALGHLRNRADSGGSKELNGDGAVIDEYATASSKAEKRAAEEGEITTCSVTSGNVMRLALLQVRRRRVRQYERFRESLSVASNCLDALRMLSHLEEVCFADESGPSSETGDTVTGSRARLHSAVHANDTELMKIVTGEVEALVLRLDRDYIEKSQESKFTMKRAVEENKAPRTPPTWREDLPYRLLSAVRGDRTGERQAVTKDEERWWVSRIAWLTAITLMTLAITFISLDYYKSKASPALSSKLVAFDRLTLPIVWGCTSHAFVPTFADLSFTSPDHVGEPIWVLRSYTNAENGEKLIYPDTAQVGEAVIVGPEDVCDESMRYMSMRNIMDSLIGTKNMTRCLSCYRIGNLKPMVVDHRSSLKRPVGAVALQFAFQYELQLCFTQTAFENEYLRELILRKLQTHATRLVEKGALVLLDTQGSGVNYVLKHGFGLTTNQRQGLASGEFFRKIKFMTEVYCNLYWFSGVFYPVRRGEAVRYSYNASAGDNAWSRLDDDRLYLQAAWYTGFYKIVFDRINRAHYLDNMHNLSNVWAFITSDPFVKMYSHEKTEGSVGQPRFMDHSAVLVSTASTSLMFSKTIEQGVPLYHTNAHYTSPPRIWHITPHSILNVTLDFASFNVQVNDRVSTTTLAEFLTDLFEYVGLFTGVCAYSVLVSPARIYLRQTQKRRRPTNARG